MQKIKFYLTFISIFLSTTATSWAKSNEFQFNENIDLYNKLESGLDLEDFAAPIMRASGERGSGGGGDSIICHSYKAKPQTLDFLLRDKSIQIRKSLKDSNSCLSNLEDIKKELSNHFPKLALGLDYFIQDLRASLNGKVPAKRAFHFSPRKLIPFNDENLTPRELEEVNSCELNQVGIRLPLPEIIHYSINIDAFKSLLNDPLQCSYFLTHEWARDFFHDAGDLRKVVHHLHSDKIEDLSKIYPQLDTMLAPTLPALYNIDNYFNEIRGFGNLAFDETNLKKRLKWFEGTYSPTNPKDCQKSVRTDNQTVYVSHLISCNSSNEIAFQCNSFKCEAKLNHSSCDDFKLTLNLNGFYSNLEIGATCNEEPFNLVMEYYKTEYEEFYQNLLKFLKE